MRGSLRLEVAAIGEGFEVFLPPMPPSLAWPVRKMRLVGADVGHLMRDDQMICRIDDRLHVVADHAGAAPAGRYIERESGSV